MRFLYVTSQSERMRNYLTQRHEVTHSILDLLRNDDGSDASILRYTLGTLRHFSASEDICSVLISQNILECVLPLLVRYTSLGTEAVESISALLQNICLCRSTKAKQDCIEASSQVLLQGLAELRQHESRYVRGLPPLPSLSDRCHDCFRPALALAQHWMRYCPIRFSAQKPWS